jgi:hypothetical protein
MKAKFKFTEKKIFSIFDIQVQSVKNEMVKLRFLVLVIILDGRQSWYIHQSLVKRERFISCDHDRMEVEFTTCTTYAICTYQH